MNSIMNHAPIDVQTLADQLLSELADAGSAPEVASGGPVIEIHGEHFRWAGLDSGPQGRGVRAVYLVQQGKVARAYRLAVTSRTDQLRDGVVEALESMERLMAPARRPPRPAHAPRPARSLMLRFLAEHGVVGDRECPESGAR